jgi:hypothetical protein
MRVVPTSRDEMLTFFENHLPLWAKSPAAIGLSADQIIALTGAVTETRSARDTRLATELTARAALFALKNEAAALRDLGTDLVAVIKAFAEVEGDPGVYAAAGIPAPQASSPLGTPPAPTEVTASINGFGVAVINWKGERRGGTYYVLERQLTGLDNIVGQWTHAGSSAVSEAIDPALPVGQRTVRYRVWARRPAGRSPAASSNVLIFGVVDDAMQTNATAVSAASIAA